MDRPDTPARRTGRLLVPVAVTLAALLLVAAAVVGSAGAASTAVTVTVSVPSAVSLTNNCTNSAGWALGSVFPGAAATTTTGAQVCSFGFSSSNDTAMIRLAQMDGAGAAMTAASGSWSGLTASDNANMMTAVGAYDTQHFVAAGHGGNVWVTNNGGTSWTTYGSVAGFAGWFYGVAKVPGNMNTWYLVGGNATVIKGTNMTTAPAFASAAGNLVAQGWPATAHVRTVYAWDANNVIIAGNNGYVAKTANGGTNWTVWQQTASGTFYDIAAQDANNLYMVGASTGWWYTTTGGGNAAAWTKINPAVTTNAATSIAIADSSHMYVVGNLGLQASCATAPCTTAANWVVNYFSDDNLTDVETDPGAPATAWAFGTRGTAYRTTNTGSSWNPRRDPTTAQDINSAAVAPGTTTLVAVGDDGTALTSATGTSWSISRSPGATPADFTSVDTDPGNGQVVLAIGGQGLVRRSTNGGAAWATQATGVNEGLYDVSFVDDGVAYAVGDNGTILRSTDGGTTWTALTSGVTVRLWRVAGSDAYNVWAVGDLNTVLRSTDGGNSWTPVATGIGGQCVLGVDVPDANHAIVVSRAGNVRVTTNGGGSWSTPTKPNGSDDLTGVAWPKGGNNIYITSSYNNVWVSTDGGSTFVLKDISTLGGPSATMLDISATTAGDVLVAGDWGQAGISHDYGATWASLATTFGNDNLRGVALTGPSSGYGVGTSGTISALTPSAVATAQVSDYGVAPSNWAGSGASSMFGVCLQAVSAQTTVNSPTWTLDNTTTPGSCQANDTDPWRAIPAAQTKVGQTGGAGQNGRIDLVWGVRLANNQSAGKYGATVMVEALAPAV